MQLLSVMFHRIFSFPLVLGALLSVGVLVFTQMNLSDTEFSKPSARQYRTAFYPDIWWQIVAAEGILSTGTWPTTDSYSFTASGSKWIAYQWLADVAMALAARFGGLAALMALLIVLSVTLLLLLYYYAYLRSRDALAASLACGLLLPGTALAFMLRPQLFGYIFLLIALIWLERFRQGRTKRLWILPPLFLVWVNTHGTFPLGLLALGFYWVGGLVEFRLGFVAGGFWTLDQRRHLAVVFLLCVLVLSLTPYGAKLAAYPLEIAFLQPVNVSAIEERQPLPVDLYWGKLILVLLLFFFFAQLFWPLTYRVEEIGLLLVSVYATFVPRRMVVFLVLVFAPLLAALLARWVPRRLAGKERPAFNLASLALIGGS
jgi:hypothetical protein